MSTLPVVLSTVACLAGCRDNPAAAAEPAGGARFVATVVCGVDVKARRTTCRLVRDSPSGGAHGPRLTVIRDASAMVETGDDAYTAADSTYRLQVRLVNTSETALGTRDGTAVTGIKAFIPVNIMGYAGRQPGDTTDPYGVLVPPMPNINNQVQARNPDGRMSFTAANQPYWNYAQKLEPGQASQWREWRFTLNPSVSYFYFAVSVFVGVPGEQEVPMAIPENWGAPARYFDPKFIVDCGRAGAPRCVYDVVDVTFRPSATQAERQAAIELVGTLESGSRMTGTYYVRIPGDTSLVALRNALGVLRALPQVEWVFPHDITSFKTNYLRPYDGAGWQQWQLRDSLADHDNWALEAVSLPLAWGCETAADSTRTVAVVDHDFHAVAELRRTHDSAGSVGVGRFTTAQDNEDHGTFVASIIGARGNDSTGMTGVMWRTRLHLLDVTSFDSAGNPRRDALGSPIITTDTILGRIQQAGRAGAAVINLSMGVSWAAIGQQFHWVPPNANYDPSTETNSARKDTINAIVRNWYREYRSVMDSLAARGHHPLVVMAAGNAGRNAWYEIWRAAGDSMASTLVVGAVRDAGSGTLAPMHAVSGGTVRASDFGSMVRIAAPGQDVRGLVSAGPAIGSGTSFAAPLVAGVAGLLVSFDRRLAGKPDSLRDLIIQSAASGGRSVMLGGQRVPILHAHEALKLVAQRPGAPLCGNRMWTESRRIVVQRGTGTETLVDLGGGISRDHIDVLHGGRQMRVNYTGQFGRDSTLTFVLQNNTWQQQGTGFTGWAASVPGSSGAYLASQRRSHGGDTLVMPYTSKVFGAALLDLYLSWSGGARKLAQLRRSQTADDLHEVCTVRSPLAAGGDTVACITKGLFSAYSEVVDWTVAYSPSGREIIVGVKRLRGTSTVSGWSPCPWPVAPGTSPRECRSFISVSTYDPSEIVSVDIATGAERTLFTFDGYPRRLAPDESGLELMFLRENAVLRQTREPGPNYMQFVIRYGPDTRTCTVEARNLRTGALKSTISAADCGATDHGVFISPVRLQP